LMVAHCSARFEHADCTLDTATGCVRLPHDSPNGGVLHGGGEVAFISSGAGLVPCTLGERPLGFNTCTESKAIAGSYSKSSVKRNPMDPSTWAASGCTSCPSGKRADSATGAVCLPCVPGQFASNTGSASCDVCLAGSYSAGFESTSCTRCPTSGYCSSPGAGDEALAFTPCVQPPNTTFPLITVALAHIHSSICLDRFPDCTFLGATGLSDASKCTPCTAGHYCRGNVRGRGTLPIVCPGGSFCPEGAAEPIACQSGRYGSVTWLATAACSGAREHCRQVRIPETGCGCWAQQSM
jgi:hypothetical protein